MQTISLSLLLIFGITSTLAQGTVIFNNHVTGTVISHVYLPSPATPGVVQLGNGPSDFPAGATDWTGWSPVSGDKFSAQLFAAPGADLPANSLAPAFPITTFRTGAFAGFVNSITATLSGVPLLAPVATIQMRVWDNKSGLITDWATALAQTPGTELLGTSATINVSPVGGLGAAPPALFGLQRFNLTYNVPKPSTFAFAGLGAFLLWLACSTKCGNGTLLSLAAQCPRLAR